MTKEIKQSKRGGPRKGAGRKPRAKRVAELVDSGILTKPAVTGNEDAPPPKRVGRPSDFRDEYVIQAERLCRLGATDIELADFFEVDVRTIYRWAQGREAFCQALRAGKEACDDRVERSLYNRAIGYTHDAVKIFMPAQASSPVYAPYREHVPPDVGAAKMWLSNRRGEQWRDRQEHVHKFQPGQMTDDQLASIAARGSEGVAASPENPGKPH